MQKCISFCVQQLTGRWMSFSGSRLPPLRQHSCKMHCFKRKRSILKPPPRRRNRLPLSPTSAALNKKAARQAPSQPPWLLLSSCPAGNIPAPWLPLTRDLSPQATEGENSQSVCSGHSALRLRGGERFRACGRGERRPLSTGGKWTERPPGGLYTKGEMPPGPPVRAHRGWFLLHTNLLSPAGLGSPV